MSRSRQLIVCTCALLALILLVGFWQRKSVGVYSFLDDAAYLDIVVSKVIGSHGFMGAGFEHPVPMIRDVLWRIFLAGGGWFLSGFTYAATALGFLFGLTTLVLSFRLASRLSGAKIFPLFVGSLLVLSPPLLQDILSGTSATLAMTLVLGAILLHLRGMRGEGAQLSLGCAFLVGVACWLRVEFALLWLIFWLHALGCALFETQARRRFVFSFIQGVNGLFVIAICLAPVLGWNYHILGVPWPRVVDAPSSLESSVETGGAFSTWIHTASTALPASYDKLLQSSFLASGVARVGVVLGAAFICVDGFRKSSGFGGALVLFLLVPLLYVLAYPFMGWHAANPIYDACTPVWLVLAAYGGWRAAESLKAVLQKANLKSIGALQDRGIYAVICGLMLLSAIGSHAVDLRITTRARKDLTQHRNDVLQYLLADKETTPLVATDRPGWLLHRGVRVVDLTGEINPEILALLNSSGRPEALQVSELLRKRQVTHLVLWDETYRYLQPALPCSNPDGIAESEDKTAPIMCRLDWSDAL